jgi:polysaccharide chain length determinant protein (PEP-CTERM system associated)
MEDLLPTIRGIAVSAWRFRWWAMLGAWVVSLLGYLAVALIPNTYHAEAVVFVDVSSRLDDVIGGVAIEWNVKEQVERVKSELLSRPVLETVARETDLDLDVTTPQEMSGLLGSLQQRITIVENVRRGADPRVPTDMLLTIGYDDVNRDTALAVVDTLLETFVRDVVRGGQTASEEARVFLTQQITQYQAMLIEREQALAAFKRENVGLLPGEAATGGMDYFTRLQTAMEALQQLQADLRTEESQLEALRAQLSSENPQLPAGLAAPVAGAAPATPASEVQTRIDGLEADLANLLLRFTEAHPDVVATRDQLQRLYDQRQQELAALATAAGSEFEGSVLSTNPVYQQIQTQLNQTKVRITALQSRIAEHERRIADLRGKVDVIPEVEARLAALTRDYDQVKSVHDQLVQRLQQERLGTAAVSGDMNFSVIQPPVAAFTPTSPNRLLLLLGVFAAAWGAGGGIAYLLSMVRPVFARARELQEFAQLPVIGTVSTMHGPARRLSQRVEVTLFACMAALLVVGFGVLVAVREGAAVLARAMLS